ncbi:type II toxin-antitoxin system HipA family toxin [Herbaspirillum lusitanum]
MMMKPEAPKRLKHLHVHTSQGPAGQLTRESQFVFGYRTEDPACEISLTMPLRAQTYASNLLPGVLRQNLPEGYLLDWLHAHFGKTMKMDDFNLLALVGADTIGRVSVNIDDNPSVPIKAEDLSALLAWKGSESLFDHLTQKYAATSGISGVQPKVLVSAYGGKDTVEKGHMKDRNLIIKASGADYDGLAENEYHCMSMARLAGIEVPLFWLSDNREVFVIERFDIDAANDRYLGFEDMTALTGRQNREKYDSSYENIAKAIDIFTSAIHKTPSLTSFFQALTLSVAVRNGDAHLKNFGLLYCTPQTHDVRLSPLYDVVCTTAYLPRDTLALKMNKAKSWPTRAELIEFGKAHCQLDRPQEIIDRVIDVVRSYSANIEPGPIWTLMYPEIVKGASSIGVPS